MRERYRKVAAVVGVAALAGGLVTLRAARGGVSGFTAVLYISGGALAAAMTYVAYRDWTSGTPVDPPDVERAVEHPYPGEGFDRKLAQFAGSGRGHLPDRNDIHERVRDLATDVLVRQSDHTLQSARAAVEAGEWPDDDPAVASFLADPDVRLPRSAMERARTLAGRADGESDFQTMVARTVDLLARRSPLVDVGADREDSVVVLDPADDATGDRTTSWPDGLTPDAGTAADTETAGDGAGTFVDSVVTGRWRVVVPLALAFVGFGFVLRETVVVLAGAVALGFGVYARAFTPPGVAPTVERSVDADDPAPGDVVEVTTTVRNDGERTLPSLTVVDGVPAGLSVADGSPRHGTTLGPGESTSFTYSVTARRGVHEFGPAYTVVRGDAGTTADVRLVGHAEGSDTSLSCVPAFDALPVPVPLYAQSSEHLGRLPAGGGEGIEFHSTREYRPGDSLSRIDWKHLARSADDELTTVRFRQERAATVALVVDTYPIAYLASDADDPGAVEHSIGAASQLFDSLLDTGDEVGVAALGGTGLWVDPATGLDHRKRVARLLATDPAFPPTAPAESGHDSRWVREFHRRFPAETQVILLSPLCDRRYRFLVRQLRGFGHPVTVVSPDPTTDGTVGQRLVRLERRLRIETLREDGVRVLDWEPSEQLAVALGRAAGRWSA
jgi:uncharacterized repeat protein (TIGR01451 family)